MTDDDKPSLDSLVIKHHGVLGQKWGVRNDDTSSGPAYSPISASEEHSSKQWIASLSNTDVSKEEAKARLAENSKKFAGKFEPSEASGSDTKKGLTNAQKKLLIKVAVGGLLVGGFLAVGYVERGNALKIASELKALAGKEVDLTTFTKGVLASQQKTWALSADGFLHPSAFARPDYTLPKGHVFHRLSGAAEKSFAKSTYATHSTEDFNRYVSIFRHEKVGLELHHITFKTTKPLKVASLTNTLDTLEEVMKRENPHVSKQTVKEAYRSMSGGSWKNARERDLFDALKAKGYGAITDEMDAGVIGESPVVIFAEHMTGKTSKTLTDADIARAEASLIEIKNRKL